ncbi:hypothetical protein VU04_10005 [Desulfobulbus sp. TB]|nr:hypothetical protein [Desulfobulbus sp. TB]
MLKLTPAQENKIRNHIIQAIKDETKNKEFKVMSCCIRITKPVVLKMNNSVTSRQVWRVIKKMASEGVILYITGEPPQVMLQEDYIKMYNDRITC